MDITTASAVAVASAAAAAAAAAASVEPPYVYHTIMLIMITGGFGGFVHGIMRKDDPKYREYILSYPFSDTTRALGFLGDIFVGIAAGVSIFFVMESLFGVSLSRSANPNLNANDYLRLVALGVVCGYLGPNLLDAVSLMISTKLTKARETLEKEKEELELLKGKVERHSKVEKLIFLGNAYKAWGQYDNALIFYDQAADVDPADPNPLIQKSTLYAKKAEEKRDKSLYNVAISYADKAIQIDKKSWRAYYNNACYKCLSGRPMGEVIDDLKAAFTIDSDGYVQRAASYDKDLSAVHDKEEFKKLVASVSAPQDKSGQVPGPVTPPDVSISA